MFAKSITGSARFLRMPVSARLLYYDLGMQADDEGVVEAFPVMRMTGASEDDLKVLNAKQFVHVVNDDLVTVIMDWKTNNSIRADRFVPSLYHDIVTGIHDDNQLTTNWQPNGNQMETQYRLGEDRLDQDRVAEANDKEPPPETIESFADSSFHGLSPIAMQELESFKEDLPEDIIRWAICQSIDGKARSWFYCKNILNRCIDMGLKTMEDVHKAEEERKRQKEIQKNQATHGYQEHTYTDSEFGKAELTSEQQQKQVDEEFERIRREHPEWYQ